MILHWNADPAAFTIPFLGDFSVRWYGILFAAGFILGYFAISKYFKKHAYPDNDLDNLLFYMFMGTIIGARLGHCFFYQPDFYLSHPLEILKIWKGGLASLSKENRMLLLSHREDLGQHLKQEVIPPGIRLHTHLSKERLCVFLQLLKAL